MAGGQADLVSAVLRNSATIARATRRRLVPVSTNLRELLDRFASWGPMAHGAAMASVALAVQGAFRAVYIASALSYDILDQAGSHPRLDPLWSNEHLRFIHDGCAVTRTEKVRFLSRFPVVLDTLRVCWLNPDGAYNCGRC